MNALRLWLAAPALALGVVAVALPDLAFAWRALLGVVALTTLLVALRMLDERVRRPLGAVANVIEGLRRGDHALRVRAEPGTALYDVHLELNALAESLHTRRLADHESTALLAAVLRELDVAVLAFDARSHLRLLNPAAERLLGCSEAQAVGKSAVELGVAAWLAPEEERSQAIDGLRGPFAIRRIPFRREGEPHELIVVAHLGGALRSEERQTWQRLLRVLSHEINNSLSPISTIADAHKKLLDEQRFSPEIVPDLAEGLDIIGRRASSLRRFLGSFAKLTRLPPPVWAAFAVSSWIRRVAALETRLSVAVEGPGNPTLVGDRDQLEQMLLNLVNNACDAALETSGQVTVRWQVSAGNLIVFVDDTGAGLANTANLFVPFFTTKAGGSGIGLVLARAIAESHGGSLDLLARTPGPGCSARVVLPLDAEATTKLATTRASLPRRRPGSAPGS